TSTVGTWDASASRRGCPSAVGSPAHWPGMVRRCPCRVARGWTASRSFPAQSWTVSASACTSTVCPACFQLTPYQPRSHWTHSARLAQEPGASAPLGRGRHRGLPDPQPVGGPLVRGAVEARVGDASHPRSRLLVQPGVVDEAGAGPEVAPHILDPTLDPPLGL